jgi:ankyrin repeat protein
MESTAALEALKQRSRVADSRSLVHACKHGNLELASLCLDAGVRVDAPGPDGTYPLEAAVTGSHEETVRLLLARGGLVNIPLLLFSATYASALTGSTAIIELLVAAGVSTSDIDPGTGLNALQLAQDMQNTHAVGALQRLCGEAR